MRDARDDAQTANHREHIRHLEDQILELTRSHREEIAALNQARIEETSNLLQRIQAPEQAVVSHLADNAGPDPAPANLENDQEMFELYEQRLQNMGVLNG